MDAPGVFWFSLLMIATLVLPIVVGLVAIAREH